MSNIFKRIERLAKSVISDFGREPDDDYRKAWDELNDFLDMESSDKFDRFPPGEGEHLAREYANLETHPSASTEELKNNYKRLLGKYHPDKFATDPDKQAIATELTVRLNESYRRIMAFRKS